MTYRELKSMMSTWTDEQLDCDMGCYLALSEERLSSSTYDFRIEFASEYNDILDEGQPEFVVQF